MRAIVSSIILLLSGALCEIASAAQSPPCFRIFDGMNFRGKPDLTAFGLEPSFIIYTGNHFWRDRKTLDQLPSRAEVHAMSRRWIATRSPAPAAVVIDLEHWPNVGSDDVVQSSVEKYLTLYRWVREDTTGGLVGFYGVLPLRDYWRAQKPDGSAEYRQWRTENDGLQRLADSVDALFPSLYTFYDHPDGWERYARANIAEARRLARGKPVYPFIWPRYHESNKKVSGYLPREYWLRQLDVLLEIADGVLLWSNQDAWDPSAAWWQATRDFMTSSPRVCRSGVVPKPPESVSMSKCCEQG